MLPTPSGAYVVNRMLRDSEQARKQRSIRFCRPDQSHISLGEFVHGLFLSLQNLVSSLCNHISCVISFCSKKQMPWVAARWVVAFVKNAQSIWNWTIRQFPRDSRRKSAFTAPPEHSVSMTTSGPDPSPAFWRFSFYNVCPKSLILRNVVSLPRYSCHVLIMLFRSSLAGTKPFSSSQNMCVAHTC